MIIRNRTTKIRCSLKHPHRWKNNAPRLIAFPFGQRPLVPEQARLPVAFGFPFGRRFSIQKPIKTNTDKEKQVFICKAPLFLLVFLCFYWFFKRRKALSFPAIPT